MTELDAPKLEYFCRIEVELDPPIELGTGRAGSRRIIPIIGGAVTSPHFAGTILTLGADWQTVYKDNTAYLDTRYAIQTSEGAVIEITNRGFRHGPTNIMEALAAGEPVPPNSYYMRTHATLETGHPTYNWINNLAFVGTGARNKGSVIMQLYAIR